MPLDKGIYFCIKYYLYIIYLLYGWGKLVSSIQVQQGAKITPVPFEAGETLLSAVVSAAIKSAAYAVVYVVSFLLLLLLLRLVLTPLHLFTKLPVVHGVNALLGGVLGLVKTALLLFLAVWVLQKLQLLVTPELVSKTVLLKFFAQNSPIDLIAKL